MDAVMKVMRSGNSEVVALPAAGRRKHGVTAGDYLIVSELPNGSIVLKPKKDGSAGIKERLAALRKDNARCTALVDMSIEEEKEAAHERE